MNEIRWLLEELTPPTVNDLAEIDRADVPAGYAVRGAGTAPTLAITLHDVVVHDVHKWFGAASLRLDALVVHGGSHQEGDGFYQPGTFRFNRVRDGQRLSIDTGGLLVFYGRPRHFLDIFITASRDRADSDDLVTLLANQVGSAQLSSAVEQVAALAGIGVSTAIPGALAGASLLGSIAYRLISSVSDTSLGLYRASWLQVRDGFGVGPHPANGVFRPNDADISFRYEIQIEDVEDS